MSDAGGRTTQFGGALAWWRGVVGRSWTTTLGLAYLVVILLACVATLPWTLGTVRESGANESSRFDVQHRTARHLPPWWWGERTTGIDSEAARRDSTARALAIEQAARAKGVPTEEFERQGFEPTAEQIAAARPRFWMGTDLLGRDVLVRCLAGGGVSLGIGMMAALISVVLGTLYGAIAGYVGGRVDGIMMRVVDVLYGLPYVLLVVLLAIAASSVMEEYVSRQGSRAAWVREHASQAAAAAGETSVDAWLLAHASEKQRLEREAGEHLPARMVSDAGRTVYGLIVLLVAIGGVSWLTMARVIRGQVMSLRAQPFVEAARAMGVSTTGIFARHLLPNLVGPIAVYAALTVPQAILQESFLSFLGIGVKPPMPSWGNLAAEGLGEINPLSLGQSHWWLLVFPCVLLGVTLLALNFVGEAMREAVDPRGR
jgi:ABC-type dipeptide/oligopeptide/nickel transport system permease subunit